MEALPWTGGRPGPRFRIEPGRDPKRWAATTAGAAERSAGLASDGRRLVLPERQHLDAVVGHEHGVLELRRERAVDGDRGPAVVEDLGLPVAEVDHRLDREGHARQQRLAGAGLAVVEDRGRGVEDPADAVAGDLAHHLVALRLGEALDGVSDVARPRARLHDTDPEPERAPRVGHEAARLRRGVADPEGARAVAVPAVEHGRHVDVHDVAVLEHVTRGRDAVADDVVRRVAAVAREGRRAVAAVAERGARGATRTRNLVDQAVDLERGDARADREADGIEDLAREAPGRTHPLHLLGGEQPRDVLAAGEAELLLVALHASAEDSSRSRTSIR